MSKRKIDTNLALFTQITVVGLVLSLTGCANNSENQYADSHRGQSVLVSLRPKADPLLVARIRDEERKQSEHQAAILTETAGAQVVKPGLGRILPGVSTDPISSFMGYERTERTTNASIKENNRQPNSSAHLPASQAFQQVSTYETAYNAVPPPPPGALGAGLVPPPPAVTLSTQAQAYANSVSESAAAFYNNPYFNPFGVPVPQQASVPTKRPAGLFGENSSRAQMSQIDTDESKPKHKADFSPITPKGMEARSPYKQRDDLRALWKGVLKDPANLGELANNRRLLEDLNRLDVGMPSESSKGTFNTSPRLVENLFKSATIDKRALPLIRKIQTDLVQSYYRYLQAYNKYSFAEQTVVARKQEVDLSDSDAERQRATADLAQAQNDLDASKDDMHSAEFELAGATSPVAARAVISRVAGVAPSIETLAQGCVRSNHNLAARAGFAGFFGSVFKHPHATAGGAAANETSDEIAKDDTKKEEIKNIPSKTNTNKKHDLNKLALNQSAENKIQANKNSTKIDKQDKDSKGKFNFFSRIRTNFAEESTEKIASSESASTVDLDAVPPPLGEKVEVPEKKKEEKPAKPQVSESNTKGGISFILNNVKTSPRKSVLLVTIKNSGSESFELNPDGIYIAEGNHKLSDGAMRADFDTTSVEPNQEIKGTVTVFGRPWNDRLAVYLTAGNKTIPLRH